MARPRAVPALALRAGGGLRPELCQRREGVQAAATDVHHRQPNSRPDHRQLQPGLPDVADAAEQQLTIAAERMERARGIIERRPLSFVLRCECYLQGFFSWSCVGIVRTGQAVLEGIRGACSLHVEFMLRLMVTRLRNISRVAESLILSALLIILS